MTRRVVVIGAGIGGLCSAIRLAQDGWKVTIVEARSSVGGLTILKVPPTFCIF
ncbi:MAG: FAD-dependent oxidoreductase [Planctomycetota bacterium]|nr:FAD-dependent oxidoreductase [Planctomycetota bacterium]